MIKAAAIPHASDLVRQRTVLLSDIEAGPPEIDVKNRYRNDEEMEIRLNIAYAAELQRRIEDINERLKNMGVDPT